MSRLTIPGCRPLFWFAISTLLVIATPICAQSGGGYDLRGNVQGAGGGAAVAPGYRMGGAVAQSGANGLGAMTANSYSMRGGLFPGDAGSDAIFSNGFESR